MSRKRRTFDIEMPEDEPAQAGTAQSPQPAARAATPPGRVPRKGPMASAISENAGALSARREAEEAIRAENDSLAHEFMDLKRAGLVVRLVPLDDVVTEALVRDRKPGPDERLEELVTSIREVGLSNPIRVEERDDERVELVQGYRRLAAYRRLLEETGDEQWARIPAGILPRGEGIAALYRRMVDENIIRKDLSFAEMAEVAQHYAADPATAPTDVDAAVAELFKSAGYQKRSYIRNFAKLLDMVGKDLAYPAEIPRSLGLALLKRLEDDPNARGRLRDRLAGWEGRSIADELEVLRAVAAAEAVDDDAETPRPAPRRAGQGGRKPRTTFEIARAGRRVKCTAGVGKLELRVDGRDFTDVDRRKLEAGLLSLLDQLD